MEQIAEAHPEINSKLALQLLNRYGPSILDNSITDDNLRYLHNTLRIQAQDAQQFVEGLLPYLNEKQNDLLMQRLIPIEVELCQGPNELFRTKTILLYLMLANARTHHFAADFFTHLTECKTDDAFFTILLSQPIPPILACAFQTTFQLIVKQKGEPLPENVLGTKLDEASESIRKKLNERKSHSKVYEAIKNIGLAELFLFSIIKSPLIENITILLDAGQSLPMIRKLHSWINRESPTYVTFCEQYYQKINAVPYPSDLIIKTREQINKDRESLMLSTQKVSIAALVASKVRVKADGMLAQYNDKLAAKKQQREPLARIDSNEAMLEQKQGLINVLTGYVEDVTLHPSAQNILVNLEYLKMTLTAFQRRAHNEDGNLDLESHHSIGDAFDQIVDVIKTAKLSDEEKLQADAIVKQIREMLADDAGISHSSNEEEVHTDRMQNI